MVFKLSKTRESEITRRRLGRSISSDSVCKPLFTCSECRHVSENEERYQSHLMEPRHINNYRDLAYKGGLHLSSQVLAPSIRFKKGFLWSDGKFVSQDTKEHQQFKSTGRSVQLSLVPSLRNLNTVGLL